LRYFLAFARVGSMQAAAKLLGVNQSTVQRRIAELEERLGRRLVERHLTSYRLTELGEELRPAAERVEAAVATFERQLAASDKDLTGTIRVTCGSILADRLRRTPLIGLPGAQSCRCSCETTFLQLKHSFVTMAPFLRFERVRPLLGTSGLCAGRLVTGWAKFSCPCGTPRSSRQAGDPQI
jgi:LSD1 subclass zinc finger protein